MEKELQIAKKIITEEIKKFGLEVKDFFLFGSRVKGNFDKDSDWAFFIIVNKDLNFTQKRKLNAQIRIRLAQLRIPNDIIIHSQSVAEKRKNDVGYLTYYLLKEGVKIL